MNQEFNRLQTWLNQSTTARQPLSKHNITLILLKNTFFEFLWALSITYLSSVADKAQAGLLPVIFNMCCTETGEQDFKWLNISLSCFNQLFQSIIILQLNLKQTETVCGVHCMTSIHHLAALSTHLSAPTASLAQLVDHDLPTIRKDQSFR